MALDRNIYRWFYDNIHSHYYNALLKWCFLPLGGEASVRRKTLDVVAFRPGEKILDMCCGTGNTTFAIADKTAGQSAIWGIDLSLGQIRIAEKRNRFPNVAFMVMDASNTCFKDGEFDKVVIPHAIHEMSRPLRLAVLKEVQRILTEGGTLAILEMDNSPNIFLRLFIAFWWFFWLPFNFETPTRRDMLKHGLSNEVEEAGFGNVSKTSLYKGVLQVVQGSK